MFLKGVINKYDVTLYRFKMILHLSNLLTVIMMLATLVPSMWMLMWIVTIEHSTPKWLIKTHYCRNEVNSIVIW